MGQGAPAVGAARGVDPPGGAVPEPGGRVEVQEDPYGQGCSLHQRGRGSGQLGEGVVRAQAEVAGGGAVGEGHECGRVGGVVAPGEAGQGPYGRFEQVGGEGGGRGTRPVRGAGEVAAVECLQEVEGVEEFGQGRRLRQGGGSLVEAYVDQLGQIAPRGGGQPGEDLRRGRPAVGGRPAGGVAQGSGSRLGGGDAADSGEIEAGRDGRRPGQPPLGAEGAPVAGGGDGERLPVGGTTHEEPLQQDLAAAVEDGTQRVEADLAGGGLVGAGQAQFRQLGLDGGPETRAGGVRGDPPAGGADENGLEGARQRPAPAERFALAEHGGDGLEELAAAGRGEPAQDGEVAGEPQGLGGLAGAAWCARRGAAPGRAG